MSAATSLRKAKEYHSQINVNRQRRDTAIAAARREGATWQQICVTVGVALRTAQMAVERSNAGKVKR
jgi:hypothetical protein